MSEYLIQTEEVTPLFDQIRRITETTEGMTFEEATASLLNIVAGGDMPNAEEASFGVSADTETGIKSIGTVSTGTKSETRTLGWKFTATEAFSIIGFRQLQNNPNFKRMKLWDSSGNLVASITAYDQATDWIAYYLDTPINVAIGETYTISVCTYYYSSSPTSATIFNSKLSDIQLVSTSGDTFPTGTAYSVYLVDIITAPVQSELPDSYEIQRTTMDDIAVEVQRISGTTGKMTTAQMLTALQAIPATDEGTT